MYILCTLVGAVQNQCGGYIRSFFLQVGKLPLRRVDPKELRKHFLRRIRRGRSQLQSDCKSVPPELPSCATHLKRIQTRLIFKSGR
jgi:hypothetical protein